MIRLRFLKSAFQNNMNENIKLIIRINWIWHSQLHITADKRLWCFAPSPKSSLRSDFRYQPNVMPYDKKMKGYENK